MGTRDRQDDEGNRGPGGRPTGRPRRRAKRSALSPVLLGVGAYLMNRRVEERRVEDDRRQQAAAMCNR